MRLDTALFEDKWKSFFTPINRIFYVGPSWSVCQPQEMDLALLAPEKLSESYVARGQVRHRSLTSQTTNLCLKFKGTPKSYKILYLLCIF